MTYTIYKDRLDIEYEINGRWWMYQKNHAGLFCNMKASMNTLLTDIFYEAEHI